MTSVPLFVLSALLPQAAGFFRAYFVGGNAGKVLGTTTTTQGFSAR